jgi:hypothetical protein
MRSVAQEVSASSRELTMIEVREVIRRWQADQSLREMARETALDRKAVRRYVEVLRELGVARDVATDDALVHEVSKRIQCRAAPEPIVGAGAAARAPRPDRAVADCEQTVATDEGTRTSSARLPRPRELRDAAALRNGRAWLGACASPPCSWQMLQQAKKHRSTSA